MKSEDVAALESRVRVLEDREAIRELKAAYCAVGDAGHDPARMVELFTEDGVWEQDGFGRFSGREALLEAFAGISENVVFMHSFVTNSVISVDGDSAVGSWSFIGPIQLATGNSSWTFVRYEEQYARVGTRWKIKHLTVTRHSSAPRVPPWTQ